MKENPRSLTLIRKFNAPIERVWDAWTMPSAWVQWYGKPWEVPPESAEMDVVVGGRWKSTTIARGNIIKFTGKFIEINKPHKLTMTIEDPDNPGNPNFETVTVILKGLEYGRTEMTFTQSGNLPPEEYQTGLKQGWTGFFDALEKYLQK